MNAEEPVGKIREDLHRQMLSAVSHDLKTPLATMIGSLEIYERMYDRLAEEKRRSLVGSALLEAYRLDRFISNILDMAKLENSMVRPSIGRCELASLIQDEILRLGPRKNRGTFRFESSLCDVQLVSDATLVSRVIGILLDNALRHSGPNPVIQIDCKQEDGKVLVIVGDNGPGIPAGKEEEIFSKYTRLTRSDQQNAGTGLGLPIARAIAALLKGDVRVRNAEKGGAEFILSLPAA